MKKLMIGIALIILLIIIMSKIYCFSVINKVYKEIMNFRSEENRYFAVTIDDSIKEEIMLKDNKLKCNEIKDGEMIYCEWQDFENDKSYSINLKNKTFSENEEMMYEEGLMKNLPSLILNIYEENHFPIKEFLNITYILPTKYENQECYKIAVNGNTIIIDKATHLPICYLVKSMNLNENFSETLTNSYEFKVGEVTDEDVEMPDLSTYTKTEKVRNR